MLKKFTNQFKFNFPSKRMLLIRFIPLILFLITFIIKVTLGIADPTSPPPPPDPGS